MVVKRHLEPTVEPKFHQDSYGYRPGESALDAIGVARQRCWRYDWVLDLDIKAIFDCIEPDLLMRAVRKHTDCPWGSCQTDEIRSQQWQDNCPLCRAELTPLSKSSGAAGFETVSRVEMTLLVEMIADRGVNGDEFL